MEASWESALFCGLVGLWGCGPSLGVDYNTESKLDDWDFSFSLLILFSFHSHLEQKITLSNLLPFTINFKKSKKNERYKINRWKQKTNSKLIQVPTEDLQATLYFSQNKPNFNNFFLRLVWNSCSIFKLFGLIFFQK